jgi:transposase
VLACHPFQRESRAKGAVRQGALQARSEIECSFNQLKQARRFATRYEKTLRNYSAVVAIGCALLWLRI